MDTFFRVLLCTYSVSVGIKNFDLAHEAETRFLRVGRRVRVDVLCELIMCWGRE